MSAPIPTSSINPPVELNQSAHVPGEDKSLATVSNISKFALTRRYFKTYLRRLGMHPAATSEVLHAVDEAVKKVEQK